ncbi:MAG: hypothetical protein MZV64_09650 [Ignavibacteriales bacterium]|nr:hypothetical protein [Ignavibacteriales bacterium]
MDLRREPGIIPGKHRKGGWNETTMGPGNRCPAFGGRGDRHLREDHENDGACQDPDRRVGMPGGKGGVFSRRVASELCPVPIPDHQREGRDDPDEPSRVFFFQLQARLHQGIRQQGRLMERPRPENRGGVEQARLGLRSELRSGMALTNLPFSRPGRESRSGMKADFASSVPRCLGTG